MATTTASPAGRTPSAQELVAALSAPDLAAPGENTATQTTLFLPRPRLVSRALLVGAMGLLAGTTLLALALAWTLAELRHVVALTDAAALPVMQVLLPPAERLCDDHSFAAWLARHPDDGVRLHAARAQALITAGRREDAAAAYAIAAASGRLDALPRVAWAELLCDLDQPEAAQRALDGADLSALSSDHLTRALAVAGRAHLLRRQRAAAQEVSVFAGGQPLPPAISPRASPSDGTRCAAP